MGLVGAVSTAQRRTKEIGVRKAMGADDGQIVALLLWQFAQPVLWGNAIAWPVAGCRGSPITSTCTGGCSQLPAWARC
jgi:hypothetical protein